MLRVHDLYLGLDLLRVQLFHLRIENPFRIVLDHILFPFLHKRAARWRGDLALTL